MPNLGDRWMSNAECAGMPESMFFPTAGKSNKPGKQVCAGCPVRRECLDYAMGLNIEHGIFGGFTGAERREMAKAGAR